MKLGYPIAARGQVVGLLGGSFDPAHAGHVAVTKAAIKRFGLDRVWWLVSPGNPLKDSGPQPLDKRMARARNVMQHPRVCVTDIEARLGTRYTADTIATLIGAYPDVRFVWLMGADNLSQFHLWQDWRWILETVPVGILARPNERISARTSMAARVFRDAKLPARASHVLARQQTPAWCFVNMPLNDNSSTAIRAGGGWVDQKW